MKSTIQEIFRKCEYRDFSTVQLNMSAITIQKESFFVKATAMIAGAITENRVYRAPPSFVRKYIISFHIL